MTLDWCNSCQQAEPWPDREPYIHCFECNHIFHTGEELLGLHNSEIESVNRIENFSMRIEPLKSPDEVTFCPLCLHDF